MTTTHEPLPRADRTGRMERADRPTQTDASAPSAGERRTERLLIPAAFITALGNNVQLIAGALLMIRSAGTMASVGWLFVAVAAPQALLSPACGRLADRFDRRRLWIGCDTASCLLALALPAWLALGGSPAAGVYTANAALALVSALFFPVSAALVKERVAPTRLRRFNADYEMATQAGMLLSATVGGLALQTLGTTPLLVFNAASFGVSALCVAGVRRRVAEGGRARQGAAVRTVKPNPDGSAAAPEAEAPQRIALGRLIAFYAQASVVVTVFNALLPTLVLGEMHRGAGTFGAVDALGSLGFLAATGAYRALSRHASDLRIAVTLFPLCAFALAAQAQFGLPGLLIGVPLGAFAYGQARIAARNLVMNSADAARAGRAFGLANSAGLGATIAVMPCVAAVTDHSNARWGFALTAALFLAATTVTAALLRTGRSGRGRRGATGGLP